MRQLLAALLTTLSANAVFAQETKMANPTVQASNDFACDLFRQLDKENAGKSLFFSPYSISTALGMTLEGARGDTAEEMGRVLRLPASLHRQGDKQPWLVGPYHQGFQEVNRRLTAKSDDLKEKAVRSKLAELRGQLQQVNGQITKLERTSKFQELNKLLTQAQALAASINTLAQQVDQFELRTANALWGEKTYPFSQAYAETVDKYYGSGSIRSADFRNSFPAERKKINDWVEEQTRNRIKDLVPELPPPLATRVRLILVNAIYFKGQWSLPFEEKATKQEDFVRADGTKVKVAMMNLLDHKQARYAAFNGDGTLFATPDLIGFDDKNVQKYPGADGFLLAELPIRGDKLAMTVLVPQKADGLPALEGKLTGANLTAWTGQLRKRVVTVALPRFKLETDYSLGDTLQKMGMKLAFMERIADFTGMTTSSDPDDRLSITRVLHKAFVEVNEQGAEAAAATAVIMAAPTSARLNVPFTPVFRADRPFVFVIRDVESGTVLFLGRVTQV